MKTFDSAPGNGSPTAGLGKAPFLEWIWTDVPLPERNRYVAFRHSFHSPVAGGGLLRITADSRYWLFLNGERLGFGPVRGWPDDWCYDEYNLGGRLRAGENVLAVVVQHYVDGNFQYIPAEPGLAVELRSSPAGVLRTSPAWKTREFLPQRSRTPRISVQEAFEEQFDARLDDDWRLPGYDDTGWSAAIRVPPSHTAVRARDIPFLSREPRLPQRIVEQRCVRPGSGVWTLNLKPALAPSDRGHNQAFVSGFIVTHVFSERAQTLDIVWPHPWHQAAPLKLNGTPAPQIRHEEKPDLARTTLSLTSGWNQLLFAYPRLTPFVEGGVEREAVGGNVHLTQFTLAWRASAGVQWAARPASEPHGAPWGFVGPFELHASVQRLAELHMDRGNHLFGEAISPSATAAHAIALWENGEIDPKTLAGENFKPIAATERPPENAYAAAAADDFGGPLHVENPEVLLGSSGGECLLHPSPVEGEDAAVLLDFGRELVGFHRFELCAPAGTIIDLHNFEFIQPDGRHNLAPGMNNALRYVCREGWQTFESFQRRGLRYTWLIVRQLRTPLRIRRIELIESTYPQANRGAFSSSDLLLDQIWKAGAESVKCCSEDTYTDCPTYEQAFWTGDARNEALVDWVVNGDPRLWWRCLEMAALSLERAPLVVSHLPSPWINVLPAWSFLWMRSCREYLLWTGDRAGAARLLPWLQRQAAAISTHRNARGLFQMHAWNLFDWAPMDTPANGAVTHVNCLAVLGLCETAELCTWLGDHEAAARFTTLAGELKAAINIHLWVESEEAYVDCLLADGRLSEVRSQQTHAVALSSGVATGARAQRCRAIVQHPPKNYVKAGSPFFAFFLLEVLADAKRHPEFIETIRDNWGFMIKQGATTFWEVWHRDRERMARSHCHAWSAAPTFFLSTTILGVHPLKPGCDEILFDPQPVDLDFIRGTVPTPHGDVHVHCRRLADGSWLNEIKAPPSIKVIRATSDPTTAATALTVDATEEILVVQ